ncbi:GNAT family N-acetyltransferase [Anaerosporobacter sp.]
MIKFADYTMIEQLKKIWKECFHDEDSYIDFFFREFFNEKTTLVYMLDGIPVSMLTLMPAKLHEKAGIRKVYYIYAVATLPEAQGKGYSSKLLNYANEITKDSTFLQPATRELKNFYERNGYSEAIVRRTSTLNLEQLRVEEEQMVKAATIPLEGKEFSIRELSEKDSALYKKIRDKQLSDVGYIEWEEAVLAFAMKENTFTGGKTLLVDDSYVVMVREYEGVLHIREHTLPRNMIISFTRQLLVDSNIQECSIHLNQFDNLQADESQLIMSRFPVEKGKGYFSLAFE